MLRLFLFFLIMGFLTGPAHIPSATAQSKKVERELKKMRRGKTFPHFFHKSLEDLEQREGPRVMLYGFQEHDTIASIGAGWGRWEVAYGTLIDSLVFYLEDIDEEKLNEQELRFNLDYYSKLKGSPVNSQFFIRIGDETSTHLPANAFNKVLVINAFHEFSDKEGMIENIYQILKNNGYLLLNEFAAFESGDKHLGCGNTIYTEEEIVNFFTEQGFKFIRSDIDIKPINSIPGTKIFIFKKVG